MGDREALARLIEPAGFKISDERRIRFPSVWHAEAAADRILAAGWRPPPELLAADLPSLDAEDWQRRHDAAEAALAETNAALAPLDAVVHALGIEDSDADPAEAVTALQAALAEARAEIERLRGAAAELCRAIKSDTFSEDRCEVSEALAQERRNRLWGAYTATRAALEAGHGR